MSRIWVIPEEAEKPTCDKRRNNVNGRVAEGKNDE